jgi:peptide/nickel transport system permease protein
MSVICFNLIWIGIFAAMGYAGYHLAGRSAYSDAIALLWRRRRVRISFYVIVLYFTIGFLDQIRIPGTGTARELSLIDLAFAPVPQERTYSAPFADTASGVTPGTEGDERNRVRGFHILGTDVNGYDVMYTVFKGAGTALILAFGTGFISYPIGVMLGILAGFFGGRIDDAIQWLYTTVASIPWLLFVIAFLMVFGRELYWICVAFGITSWVGIARLIRGETLKLKQMDYITAAKASGTPIARVLYRHLFPNLIYLVIIDFTLFISHIILAESVLTFIGIGVAPGTSSWGVMLVEAQKELMRSPAIWWIFAGGSFAGILPLVLSLNVFGDSLRDALDPRLRGRS